MFTIEKNVPVVSKKKGNIKFEAMKETMMKMEIGDSFLAPISMVGTFQNAKRVPELTSVGKHFRSVTIDADNMRIYRMY